jgi:hypothetical protein
MFNVCYVLVLNSMRNCTIAQVATYKLLIFIFNSSQFFAI